MADKQIEEWTEGDVDAGGVGIHFVRTGTGTKPPMVLVHGFTDNGRCWTRVARALESTFDVVMIDARNHGASATAGGTSADMADDLATLVAHLGLGAVSVVGHSLGANTSAELAVRHPHLVDRLVLEDPPWRHSSDAGGDPLVRRAGLASFLESFHDQSYEEILATGTQQYPRWDQADLPAWATAKQQVRPEAIESITAHHWAELVPQLRCPTLLIHGEVALGGIVDAALATEVARLNDHVAVVGLAGAGHNVRREAFNDFMTALRAFLDGP